MSAYNNKPASVNVTQTHPHLQSHQQIANYSLPLYIMFTIGKRFKGETLHPKSNFGTR